MAESDDLTSFSKRVIALGELIQENATDMVRKAALAADQVIVMGTPVDTGRARSNWIASLVEPSVSVIEPYVPSDGAASGAAAMKQAQGIVEQFNAGAGQTFWLSNNLPYIQRLEEGWSPQNEGFVEEGVEAAIAVMNATDLLEGQ